MNTNYNNSKGLVSTSEIQTKLKLTADELIKKSKQTIRRREIEDIILSIPTCCVDIIFEYQHESRLRIIDLAL